MGKLKRSKSDRMISGVCGGLGEYFNIDSTIIRIGWIFLSFITFGTFLLAYIACSIIIPEDDGIIYQDEVQNNVKDNSSLFIGVGLIILGSFLLLRIFFPWLNFKIRNVLRYWPALFILLGIYILINQKNNN